MAVERVVALREEHRGCGDRRARLHRMLPIVKAEAKDFFRVRHTGAELYLAFVQEHARGFTAADRRLHQRTQPAVPILEHVVDSCRHSFPEYSRCGLDVENAFRRLHPEAVFAILTDGEEGHSLGHLTRRRLHSRPEACTCINIASCQRAHCACHDSCTCGFQKSSATRFHKLTP